MASCVFSLFFLVSLISSVTPAGLKIRITEKARLVLIGHGIKNLQGLVGKSVPKMGEITRVEVDPAQVNLHFMPNNILKFEINNLQMTVKKSETTSTDVTDLRVLIGVELQQKADGHLNIAIEECNIRAQSETQSTSKWEHFLGYSAKTLVNKLFCVLLRNYPIPKINKMLKNLVKTKIKAMLKDITVERTPIRIDYSLSDRGIAVTDDHLEVSFRGLVQRQDTREILVDNIAMTNQMTCVGVSEYLFNSAARILYNLGPLQFNFLKMHPYLHCAMSFFAGINFSHDKGKVHMRFNDVPTFAIRKGEGLFANLNVRLQQDTEFHDMNAEIALKPEFKGGRLALSIKDLRFVDNSVGYFQKWIGKLFNYMSGPAINFAVWYYNGIPMPLPEGLGFESGNIEYHDGYMVAEGDLVLMEPEEEHEEEQEEEEQQQ